MKACELHSIRSYESWREFRVEVIDTAQGPVIVKGQRHKRNEYLRRLFDWIARDFSLPMLQVPVRDGGARAQEVEVRRLHELHAAGLPVPRVLHVEEEFFVREFLHGEELARLLERQTPDVLPLWTQGLRTIQSFHQRSQYFSQAFARNFIVTERGIVAIDFEEDPLDVMSLAEAQARDWLLYLQSTVWLLPKGDGRAMQIWRDAIRTEDPAQTGLLRKLALRLGWLRHLPDKRKPWGRDLVSAQAAAAFLFVWAVEAAGQFS